MATTPDGRRRAAILTPIVATRVIGRYYFGTTAMIGAAGASLYALLTPSLPELTRTSLVTGLVMLTVLSLLALALCEKRQFPMRTALCGVSVFAMLLVQLMAAATDDGLRSPALGFGAIIVCVIGSITGVRFGTAMALLAAAGCGALGWLEASGHVPVAAASLVPTSVALALQWLLIFGGTLGGAMISRALAQSLHAAAERELRFQGLLRIATDWYWEQDRHFNFTTVTEASVDAMADALVDTTADFAFSGASTTQPPPGSGAELGRPSRPPWRLEEMGLAPGDLARHRAEVEAHLPFDNLIAHRRDASGHWRTISLSGEPKFDAAGLFAGYWGVARDVTDEMLAQRAVAVSETRYRELFTRSPSPLMLHRRGLIFDANEAAARLFGFESASAMNGLSLLTLLPLGPAREVVMERLDQLELLPVGKGLPVMDAQFRALDGRMLYVQSTAVRIDTTSGAANLSILFDITGRKAVEGALRRSEAMLSQLFATSPDCIVLIDLATQRFAMVNAAFCNVSGYAAEEVIGRTGQEIGVLEDEQPTARLLAQLGRDGRVVDMPAVFVAKSGARISMLLAAGRFEMDRNDYLVVNARDVTESERTRLQHAAILERASIGIAFTREARFVQANPYFEKMFGWEPGSLIGQPGAVVWASNAEDGEMSELAATLLAAGRPFEMERRMRRKDGSRFWCRVLAQAVDRSEPGRSGTIWIAEDVTERRRLDEALAAARDAAEAASRAKSAFLANTSHEIRTPLNGLLGLARLALQSDLSEDRRQKYLAQIVHSADGLAGIMSDILDVSKIEAGKLAIEDVAFDLHEALRALYHAYEPMAEVKGLEMQLSIDRRVPANVRGDPVRVRQIVTNFVTNALKFTERGRVRIEAVRSDGEGSVRLAVSDTGPGIAEETQRRLFARFSQGDSSTTRRYGGTGLGLSICREIAQLMGGRVGVDSTPGRGSTFWAELPLTDAAPPPLPTDTEAADLAQLSGLKALLAEDNPVNMMIGTAMLETWGIEVEQVVDGQQAVEAVRRAARTGQPFDLVVMDVQMPVMGGHEAARTLRRDHSAETLPIVALTAAALVSEREEALDAGMNAFLSKPIDALALRETLVRLTRERNDA